MLVVLSRNRIPVCLTEERWRHVVVRHPEMDGQREKYVVVAYREMSIEDGFILTAYLSRRPSSRREALWKR